MNFEKGSILSSPYVGIFAKVTNKIGLFPTQLTKKEIKKFEEIFDIEIVQTSIAKSSFLGALIVGNKNGFLIPQITEKSEKEFLKEQGLKIKEIKTMHTALGNLVSTNDKNALISELLKKNKSVIEKFLKVKIKTKNLNKSVVTGANLLTTNKGFLVNPQITNKEFEFIEKFFGLNGKGTTANYGDIFISNNILANDSGILVGKYTTNHEIERIDEVLRK